MRLTAKELRPQIEAIARASTRMNRDDAIVWQTRLQLIYGDLEGQRRVDFTSISGNLDRRSTIIAIESLYYLLTTLISTSAFVDNPAAHLRTTSRLSDLQLTHFLRKLCRGRVYEELGIAPCNDVYPLDWLHDSDCSLRTALRDLVRLAADCWDGSTLKFAGDDPFQTIHRQLFPNNLAHITGQFFSPEWLAELLIQDVGWTPGQTLMDPFCGSGVFLIKALRSALRDGHQPTDVLPQLIGIDIDPFAAAAARANLALFIARCGHCPRSPIHLNVLCADAIFPSILKGTAAEPADSSSPHPPVADVTMMALQRGDWATIDAIFRAAAWHGFELRDWKPAAPNSGCNESVEPPLYQPHVVQQLLTCCLNKADVVATNPPWVGWEYLSRPYRSAIQNAWTAYELFRSKGLEASFLKEDLSNLALLAAWDNYLRPSGRSVVVLRPSTMHSEVASRGVRRLSLSEGGEDLKLEHIRCFDRIRVFKSAHTVAATWLIRKGEKTQFPVPVSEFQKIRPHWNPKPTDHASQFAENVRVVDKVAEPTDPEDGTSRWMITTDEERRRLTRLRGSNEYTPRMGVFTGGANGVFYLQRATGDTDRRYKNITANCKRRVPSVEVEIERTLVHSVARGRDLGMWQCRAEVFLLLPHTRTSQMYPIPEDRLASEFPKAYQYLCGMRPVLQARNGFAGWERKFQQNCFYTLQRVGPYTFAPYKVCWRYIASGFTICVLENDRDGKTIVPNDKVMFIPLDDPDEAYFVAGFLSSELVRMYVGCVAEKRQISTRVIKSLAIPRYDRSNPSHQVVRDCCRQGHMLLRQQPAADISPLTAQIDGRVKEMFDRPGSVSGHQKPRR